MLEPHHHTWATPIICWKLSSSGVRRGPRAISVKPCWHLLFPVQTLPACCTTDCHYLRTQSSSATSSPLNIFQDAVCLSVGVCARIYSWINVCFLLECQGCRRVNMCKVRYELCAINFWIPLLAHEHRKSKRHVGRHAGDIGACLWIPLVSQDTTALIGARVPWLDCARNCDVWN